ncbi:MAG: hypothetical protein ACR2QM_00115 [Longimicrobiales bacterium]
MIRYSPFASIVPALSLLGLVPIQAGAQETIAPADIQPPQVHQLAVNIQEDLETLRWHMGKPIEGRPFIPVEDVAIRENFRQAMTLWSKVNELGVELVGGGEPAPIVPAPRGGEYGPAQVHQVLVDVLDRLAEIRSGTEIVGAAAINGESNAPRLDPTATPDDVFKVIVQNNRQVNRMLERSTQPGDVYQQFQQATFYASEILAAIDDPNPFPNMPPHQPGMTPGHVYGRVLGVFDRLSVAFEALGLEMVDWAGGAYQIDQTITPGDVIDLGTLLLSELEYLHSRIPGARAPINAAHPGTRWPSDVYQLVGLLDDQATRIMVQARQNPGLFGEPGEN